MEKQNSWRMFDDISPTYDLINHSLSLGQDVLWRKKLAGSLTEEKDQVVLDLATGTGDVLLSVLKHNENVKEGYGIDLSDKMLNIGVQKVNRAGLKNRLFLIHGDANKIPFPEDKFSAVTIAFGIRNVEEPSRVLSEMHRVLKENGRALVLEFSLPENRLLRAIHLFYLRNIVPFAGGLLSGNRKAYSYLNRTIEDFPYGDDFCRLMKEAGFKNIKGTELMFGAVTIYQGDKVIKE